MKKAKSSIPARALKILETIAKTDAVRKDPELPLFERHLLDSMRTVELVVAFSREFSIEISLADFDPAVIATPGKIVKYLESRVGA